MSLKSSVWRKCDCYLFITQTHTWEDGKHVLSAEGGSGTTQIGLPFARRQAGGEGGIIALPNSHRQIHLIPQPIRMLFCSHEHPTASGENENTSGKEVTLDSGSYLERKQQEGRRLYTPLFLEEVESAGRALTVPSIQIGECCEAGTQTGWQQKKRQVVKSKKDTKKEGR